MSMGTPAQDEITTRIKAAFSAWLPSLNVDNIQLSMDSDSGALTVDVWFTLPDRTLTTTSVTYNNGVIVDETNPYEVFVQ